MTENIVQYFRVSVSLCPGHSIIYSASVRCLVLGKVEAQKQVPDVTRALHICHLAWAIATFHLPTMEISVRLQQPHAVMKTKLVSWESRDQKKKKKQSASV